MTSGMTISGLQSVAYFSMEMALEPTMPTYAGGLGVLAGDTLRAAADLGVPMVGVTLLHRRGYFRQTLDREGNQSEHPAEWRPESVLEPVPTRAVISIEGRPVRIAGWRYVVRGCESHEVLVYLLDTRLPENSEEDQALTDSLYGGDTRHRLLQEAVLGLGGVAMLRALGLDGAWTYHMNEGHSALLAMALLEEEAGARRLRGVTAEDREAVRRRCVFTTHTPVPAGHDQFPMDLVRQVMGEEYARAIEANGCCPDGVLNTTFMALFFSRYINGVSMRHEEVSQSMFPRYPVNSITNGVHATTWTAAPFARLYDRYIPQWRHDNRYLHNAVRIPLEEVHGAHQGAKQELLAEVELRTGRRLNPRTMTLGFARRATSYKRADLLVSNLERLRAVARNAGPLQILYAGKAHPRDEGGKELIRRIFAAASALGDAVPVIYLEEYDMGLARLLCAGVDLWVNTPQKPQEASGTSGMKAALNGVPSLSVLDGWWVEGWIEGVTGWAIGDDWGVGSDPAREAASLYDKMDSIILPTYYNRPDAYAKTMRSSIALVGSFFNAQRMVSQYQQNAYHVAHRVVRAETRAGAAAG